MRMSQCSVVEKNTGEIMTTSIEHQSTKILWSIQPIPLLYNIFKLFCQIVHTNERRHEQGHWHIWKKAHLYKAILVSFFLSIWLTHLIVHIF